MTIAFISDVHANLPALDAVLADIDARGVDALYCLGDLVGYAPWPNEVVHAVRSRRIPTIAGNYDEGVGLHSDDCGCAYKTPEDEERGAESIAFTNAAVSDDTRVYLRGLPRHIRVVFEEPRTRTAVPFELLMVHGSPRKVNEYLFEDRPDKSFHRMMETASADVMLFGHTHKPYHKVLEYDVDGELHFRHAVNTGSVGKPKDGDPRACYVLLRTPFGGSSSSSRSSPALEGINVEFVRVEYDVEKAARAIEDSPLPDAFAAMLRDAY